MPLDEFIDEEIPPWLRELSEGEISSKEFPLSEEIISEEEIAITSEAQLEGEEEIASHVPSPKETSEMEGEELVSEVSALEIEPGEAEEDVALEKAPSLEELPPTEDFARGVAPITEGEEEIFGEEIPEWLKGLPKVEAFIEVSEEKEAEIDLEQAELPEWLESIRPAEIVTPKPAIEEKVEVKVERAGPLVGLQNVLPAEPDIARQKKPPSYSVKLQVSEKQQSRIAILEDLIKAEGKPRPLPRPQVISSQHILRILIFIVLTLAALWSLLIGGKEVELPDFSREVYDTSQIINAIPGGAPVLIAVDYEPGFSAELDAVSRPVLDHLMLNGAYITLVSTIPTGPIQAARLMQAVNELGDHGYQIGDQFNNLGYIPGGISGILSFAETPQKILPFDLNGNQVWNIEPLKYIRGLKDFSAVIVPVSYTHLTLPTKRIV